MCGGRAAGTISNIECGKTQPRPSTVRALASVLGVPIQRFYVRPNRVPALVQRRMSEL